MGKNAIIGQSGGPTAAINASLAGTVRQAMRSREIGRVYGMLHGIEGLLQGRVIDLERSFTNTEDFERLAATPAMALGSCRYKLPKAPHPAYETILQIFNQYDIGYFFYIGGNDSMDTVLQLSAYFRQQGADIRCVGIPKTVDNDLPCTDHTPGFGSAAKYVASSIAEVARDCAVYDKPSVLIVEIMGRNAGWLTAASALAREAGCGAPQLIYLPEVAFDPEKFIEKVREHTGKGPLVAAVSEGVKLADGNYVSAAGSSADAFGHVALSGTGRYLEQLVKEKLGCKVRSLELSLLQRAAAHCASATDIAEAMEIGEAAVVRALHGKTGVMMTFDRVRQHPYLVQCGCVPIEECANLEKTVPAAWICGEGSDVTEEMLEYLRPLVRGEAPTFTKEGMPSFFTLDKTPVKP